MNEPFWADSPPDANLIIYTTTAAAIAATTDKCPSCVPQAQYYRFQHTFVYCIGDNGEAGDSSARRSTLDFGIWGNAMPAIIG